MRFFLTKWTVWEYLPWWIANIPVYGFFLWFAARARHLFFFTNVNPAIPLGGAIGESKYDIIRLLPPALTPATVFVPAGLAIGQVLSQLSEAGITFPLIAKPDVGERGLMVRKIDNADQLARHLAKHPIHFLIQEFLDLPLEFSVLFHRFPGQSCRITSVCEKAFMQVTGDGQATVRMLMAREARSAFQLSRFERDCPAVLDETPAAGQVVLLEPIGNHARGTKFLNANHLIDAELEAAFAPAVARLDGILYGRFDLKCASVAELKAGRFKVMELNGVLGEPAHIYDPAFGMWRAYRDLYRHWKIIFRLHRAQRALGILPTPNREGFSMVRTYFRYKKQFSS